MHVNQNKTFLEAESRQATRTKDETQKADANNLVAAMVGGRWILVIDDGVHACTQ